MSEMTFEYTISNEEFLEWFKNEIKFHKFMQEQYNYYELLETMKNIKTIWT